MLSILLFCLDISTKIDRAADVINPAYEAWEVQDQMASIYSFLVCSLSRVLGCTHSYEVWKRIHEYFNLQTKSRAHQFRTATRAVKLESKSVEDYLLKIKNYVDELAGVGFPVRHDEHVDAISEGLPSDYASIVSVIREQQEASFHC